MKRVLLVASAVCAMSFIPLNSYAVDGLTTPSPTATVSAKSSPTPKPSLSSAAGNRAAGDLARKNARDVYNAAITQNQNGRDLALADAKATLMQSMAAAGKDKAARKVAQDTFQANTGVIIAAFKKSMEVDTQVYKDALAAIKKK